MTSPSKKIAVLVSSNMLAGNENTRDDLFELDEQMGKLTPAFAKHHMDVTLVNWREAAQVANEYDAMLPFFVWDYFEQNEEEFFETMAKVCQQTELYNPFDVLKWNSNKSYLEDLGARGASIIPSISVERVTEKLVLRAMDEFGANKIVIKPIVGGAAWRQVLYEKGAAFPSKEELPPKAALLQPFLSSVKTQGEYSFLYFGGGFSHALIKRPKDGDYRVQSIYGGQEIAYTPSTQERAQVRAVLDVLDFTPLYARIDFLRADDGRLLLIELELIEPYLYLPFSGGEGADNKGAQKLAKALARRLENN